MEDDVKCKGVESMTVVYSPNVLGESVWIEVIDNKIVDVINQDTGATPTLVINASGDELPSNTEFKIYNINADSSRGSFIEEIKIHTSCSKPINEGDIHLTSDGVLTIMSLTKIF